MRGWSAENKTKKKFWIGQKENRENLAKKGTTLKFHKILQKMNNEHYDEIGRTEDFSMISTMEDGEFDWKFNAIASP